MIILMTAGIILSITMLIPYKEKIVRSKRYRDSSQGAKIIEADSSDWKLWLLRSALLGGMIFTTIDTYFAPHNYTILMLLLLLYGILFLLHFMIYRKLDRKYYFSQQGLWVGKIEGAPTPYGKLEVIKLRMTTAPFSGSNGNLEIYMRIKEKRYKAVIFKEDEEETGADLSDQQQVIEWLPNIKIKDPSETNKFNSKKLGMIIICTGAAMTVTFGLLTFIGLDAGQAISESASTNAPNLLGDGAVGCMLLGIVIIIIGGFLYNKGKYATFTKSSSKNNFTVYKRMTDRIITKKVQIVTFIIILLVIAVAIVKSVFYS